jgi:hypothetical protein
MFYEIEYHRVCDLDKIHTFDWSYLLVMILVALLVLGFARNRLPDFLYFNSAEYRKIKADIKVLKK